MTRCTILLALMLVACRQAAPPADNATVNAGAGVAATAVEARPATKGTPVGSSTEPEPLTIPAKFRGTWAEGRAACAQLSHHSRLIISERVIRYPSLVLVSESVDRPTDSSFAVKGHSQRTGAPVEAHFSIDAAGRVLTDEAGGGTVRERCG